MKGIKSEQIEVNGKKLKVVNFEGQKLVSVKDLTLEIGTKEIPYWIYQMCQANKSEFKKVTVAFKLSNHSMKQKHLVNQRRWFATVNGMKSIYQELVKKYGISSYTKKFYLFTGKVAAALMEKPKESEEKSNQPLHLIAKVENNRPLVSARELYKALEIKSRFAQWIEQNFSDFEQGYDYTSAFINANVGNGGTRRIQDYLMTTDMAKELCMLSRTPKGKQVRKYFIQVEKKYRQQVSLPQTSRLTTKQMLAALTPEQLVGKFAQASFNQSKQIRRQDKRLTRVEKNVDYLKNKSAIERNQREKITATVKAKSVKACGGKESNYYKQRSHNKVFGQLYQDLYRQFSISSYQDLAKDQYNKALAFINNWQPHADLQQEIDQVNAQTNLDI